MRRTQMWALPLVALAAAAVTTGIATAGSEEEKDAGVSPAPVSAQEAQAIAKYCPPGLNMIGTDATCHIVDIDADERSGLESLGETLARHEVLDPAECPEASAVYEAAGQPADAYIGRCPDPSELPSAGRMKRALDSYAEAAKEGK